VSPDCNDDVVCKIKTRCFLCNFVARTYYPFVILMHFTARSATQVRRNVMRLPHLNFKILAKPFR
jgi:hypothetical protein